MKSIIKEIFLGNRGHLDDIEMDTDHKKAAEQLAELHKEFLNALPEEKRAAFEMLCEAFDAEHYYSSNVYFVEGVKLGILLGVEACN